ncbi:Cyclin C [Aphelenchoides avenae]|nr:Cyclin C [Aphelenchus avenae]
MAGNFWKSSQFEQWILEKHDLLRERGEDLKIFTEDEYQKLMIFFMNFIQTIGQDSHNGKTRMQVISTACVYFRRFYARRSFKDIDPFLLAPTCLLLASKVEEHGLMSTTKLANSVQHALKKWPFLNQDLIIRTNLLHEAEFCLLEVMDCCLIVYHPYRPLNQLINDMKISGIKDIDSVHQDAWRVCNDSLRTDASLLYPPHLIAIACIMVAALMHNKEKEMKAWFAELAVDFDKVFELQQMIFNMYRIWKTLDEKPKSDDKSKSSDDKQPLVTLLEKLPRPSSTANPPANVQQNNGFSTA